MINKPKEIAFSKSADLIAEPKFDGMRAIITTENNTIDILHDTTSKMLQFPELTPTIPDDTIIDGEICIPLSEYSADFETLQKRITLQNKLTIKRYTETIPVKFMAFDILKYKGKDLTNHSYKDRRDYLKMAVGNQGQNNLEVVQVATTDAMWDIVHACQGEGIVVKNIHGKYNDQWIKKKNWLEYDLKVDKLDIRSTNWVLHLVDQDKRDVGKVTLTGYERTEELKKKIVGMTAVVKCLSLKNKLRIPILKELRS